MQCAMFKAKYVSRQDDDWLNNFQVNLFRPTDPTKLPFVSEKISRLFLDKHSTKDGSHGLATALCLVIYSLCSLPLSSSVSSLVDSSSSSKLSSLLQYTYIIRLHRMLEMQTWYRCVRCQSVRSSSLSVANALNDPTQRSRLETRLHCVGSFGAAYAKPLWPLVIILAL